jgi:hypothetical protein
MHFLPNRNRKKTIVSLYNIYKSLKEKYKFHVVMMQCGSFFNFYDEDAEFIADQFNLKLYTLWGHKQCGIPTKANLDKYINFFNEAKLSYALIIQIKNESKDEFYRVISESNIKEAIGLRVGLSKKITKHEESNDNELEFLKAISKGYNPLTGEVLDKSSAWKHPQIIDDIKEYFNTLDHEPLGYANSKNQITDLKGKVSGINNGAYYLDGQRYENQKEWREALKNSEYKNSYKSWDAEEDAKLKELSNRESVGILSKLFNRSKGAITSRLKKLSQTHQKMKK